MGPQNQPQVPQMTPQPEQPVQPPQPMQPQSQSPWQPQSQPQPTQMQQPQPQWQAQPFAPQPQANPFAQAPMPTQGMPAPVSPKKGVNKKALFAIIGGAVATIVLAVGVILAVTLFGGPSKEDYRAAAKIMSDFSTNDIMDFTSGSDADEIKKMIDEGIVKIDKHYEELKATKAMKDADVKKAFDAYYKEYEVAKPILQEMAGALEIYNKYSQNCRSSVSISTLNLTGAQAGQEFDKKNSACMGVLTEMAKSESKDVSDFAKAQSDYMKNMRQYYVAIANRYTNRDYSSPMPEYPSYPKTTNPLTGLSNKLSDTKLSEREDDLYELLKDKADK